MAWTTPRTWVTAEVVTAALMNTHVRDNLNFLKTVGALTHTAAIEQTTSDLTLTTSPQDCPNSSGSFTTTIANATWLTVGFWHMQVDTASAGVVLFGRMNVAGTDDAEAARMDDFGDADWGGPIGMCWRGTIVTPGSTTWKQRADKDTASGVYQCMRSATRFILAVFE